MRTTGRDARPGVRPRLHENPPAAWPGGRTTDPRGSRPGDRADRSGRPRTGRPNEKRWRRKTPFTEHTEEHSHVRRNTAKKGFTLIEILIVVIILGILAAIVIPQFSSASSDAKKASLRSTVQTLRSQIALYKLQHGDTLPNLSGAGGNGWPALTASSVYRARPLARTCSPSRSTR